MDTPDHQHPMSHVVHQSSAPSMRLDPRAPNLPPDEPPVSFKAHFNTLYDSRWLIGIITALLTVGALLYALVA